MNTITRTGTRTGGINLVTEAEYPSTWASWCEMRANAHRDLWEQRRRTLGLLYRVTAEQRTRIDRDAIYLAQCDNWDAVHADCEPILAL